MLWMTRLLDHQIAILDLFEYEHATYDRRIKVYLFLAKMFSE